MDVDAALQSQIRNIEATYGKPLDHWFTVIDASGWLAHLDADICRQRSACARPPAGRPGRSSAASPPAWTSSPGPGGSRT